MNPRRWPVIVSIISLYFVGTTALPARVDPPEPVSAGQRELAFERGVKHLIETQNYRGSWGSPRWSGGVDGDPLTAHDSFEAATTALALEALLYAGDGPKVVAARQRAEAYLLDQLPNLKRADTGNLPNVWGHCYGIQVLAELHRRTPADQSERRRKLVGRMRQQVGELEKYETVHGGWFYYASGFQRPLAPSCSFVNAAVLAALHRAKPAGVTMAEPVFGRALAATKLARLPDSSFLYTHQTALDRQGAAAAINRPAGSLGRSQAGNLALRLWGDDRITDAVLKEWLDRMVTRQGWLDMGRKRPIPHESHAQVAGYFYYFGHYYAGQCIGQLPEADRPAYQDHLARIILDRQEEDGSWWDYPLYSYHKPYGTAFALLTLQACRR